MVGINKLRRARESGVELTKTALVTGIGANILGGVGGQVATQGQQGLSRFSRGFGPVGTVIGGRLSIDLVRDLTPKKRKKNRR